MTPLLTPGQAAALLGTSRSWVLKHADGPKAKAPVIPCMRVGRVIRFDAADLERFKEQNTAVPVTRLRRSA